MPIKLTTQKFVNRAIGIHGDVYDYSLVEYRHSRIPVKIICSRHGIFLQKPDNHTHSHRPCGCPVCGKRGTTIERFWAFVDKGKEDECWNWKGSKNYKGYGNFRAEKKMIRAHVFSYQLHYGKIPKDTTVLVGRLLICHHCDNPSCVNPVHLFAGTNSDNMKDASKKGRLPDIKGENAPNSKLTWDEVREIRKLYKLENYTQDKLGSLFGVSQGAIGRIVRNEIWKIQ